MALDVDVVECHGSGRFIADAIEAGGWPAGQKSMDSMVITPVINGIFVGLIHLEHHWGYNPLTKWDEPPSEPLKIDKNSMVN